MRMRREQMLQNIKGIFFDAGGVLFRPYSSDWFINRTMLRLVGEERLANIPPEKRSAAFASALKYLDDFHHLETEDQELRQFRTFYSIISEALPELGLSEHQIDEIAYAKVYDMENYIFFPDVKPVLEQLYRKYKLGIISDTWPSIERILSSGGVNEMFCTKTYSCRIGTYKPNRAMYLHALNQMGYPPEQTVFIDDCEENLDGAVEMRIHPILMKRSAGVKDSGRYSSISSLGELLEML